MVDKITSIRRERIAQVIGSLRPPELRALDEAFTRWLGLTLVRTD